MSDPEIRVGLSISLSGSFQLQGQQARQGFLLWQSHTNGQGGITVRNGDKRPVRLIWYDDRSQISFARENVSRLLRADQVDVLLGPYSSSLTMAVAEIAEEYKKILWNHGGSSDEIFRHGRRYLVGITSPASDYLRALPPWLVEEHSSLSRICVLYSGKGTFGWQVARGVLESARALGHQSVELIPINSPLEKDDSTLLILFDIAPEIVVLAASFQDELDIMRTRPTWPNSVRVVAAVAAGLGDFSAQLVQAADGVLGSSQWEPGVNFFNIIGPASAWFIDSFQEQFGKPPEYVAAASFATGLILTECIRRAASLNDERLRAIADDLDCNTLYGRFRVDSRTGIQVGHRVLLIRWQGGRKLVLHPHPSSDSG